jgi:DNA-binding HxlR family transcriptional regulator
LTAKPVNGSGNGARSGAKTLTLLAAPLNCHILHSLAEGSKQQIELRRETGAPAQTTLRGQLKKLADAGTISKQRRNRFPGVLEYELTEAGHDLLFVASVLERWLDDSSGPPLTLGGDAAKAAIKAFAEGWSTSMLRALAARPLSLTELDSVIAALSYPALERRLGAMRLAGQVEPFPSKNGRGTPYTVTGWMRSGVAPLLAAARWEQRHQPSDAPSLTGIDAETAFLLAAPLLRCGTGVAGTCQIVVEIPTEGRRRLAGVAMEIAGGRATSCSTRLRGHPEASASGPPLAWLEAMVEGATGKLEVNGDSALVHEVLRALHDGLFGTELDRNRSIGEDRSD